MSVTSLGIFIAEVLMGQDHVLLVLHIAVKRVQKLIMSAPKALPEWGQRYTIYKVWGPGLWWKRLANTCKWCRHFCGCRYGSRGLEAVQARLWQFVPSPQGVVTWRCEFDWRWATLSVGSFGSVQFGIVGDKVEHFVFVALLQGDVSGIDFL